MAQKKLRTEVLRIGGMTCASCENRIEKGLLKLKGVSEANASYGKGTVTVAFDDADTSLGKITRAIEDLDYSVLGTAGASIGRGYDSRRIIGAAMIILALYVFLNYGGGGGLLSGLFTMFPQAEAGMGYGMLFVVGLLTSVHCIAMCGGINLSQCLGGGYPGKIDLSSLKPSLLYNSGRVASYTVVGGIVGAVGSVVSFSGGAKGAVQLVAGVFMVIIGVNMLGAFSFMREFVPRMPKFITKRIDGWKSGRGPLYVGLLNGLMPCGPLQAMQIYALSTGDPIKGALSMFAFSIGTAPLMFILGAFGSLMSRKFAGTLTRVGAALVIVMGIAMFNNGASLSGLGDSIAAESPITASQPAEAFGALQLITTDMPRFGYPPITVKAGAPVKWTLRAAKGTINGCNNAIIIPAFKIEKKLSVGDNVIEFTPMKAGVYRYSCWMGMIRSTITVVDGDVPSASEKPQASAVPQIGASAAEAAEEIDEDDENYRQFSGSCPMTAFGGEDGEGGFSWDDDDDEATNPGASPARPSQRRALRSGCCAPIRN
ncbi:MAG: sulfite exporter TauE/SafE family protein [Synergistaceae bacterium]|nr:sulfite exporter TauE/SafE family protein [Synergistaceae bacterium]